MKQNINAIITIAWRDLTKLLRDKPRILATFIFPLVFIGVLGTSLQSNLGASAGFNLLVFTFTGVLAQTLFQSSAAGVISLIEDRDNDFAQELFISPVSRYAIIFGKIFGESLVALLQAFGIILFGFVFGVRFPILFILSFIPASLLICFMGGAFGIFVLSRFSGQRSINQIFPFIIFPQYFLAGIFTPVRNLPLPLLIASRAAPMTYAVDFMRGLYYTGAPEYSKVVLYSQSLNFSIILALFIVFLFFGTLLFVRNERNR